MKKKYLKFLILVLFILFNVLSLIVYMHIQTKMNNHEIYELNTNIFNKINLNEVYQNEKIIHYKLVCLSDIEMNYEMISYNYDYKNLIKIFNDENELYKYINESKIDKSKFNADDTVYNYLDKFGILLKDNYMNIEIYNKEEIFNTNIDLYNYDDIIKALGETNIVKINKDSFDYYILCYKEDDYYIQFISYYEDGRNCICIISKDIIM